MGNPDAPVKLVEYASLTCPHCARISPTKATAALRDTYVRSGQVSWEFRHFLLNAPDLALSLLARCQPPAAFFAHDRADLSRSRPNSSTAIDEDEGPARSARCRPSSRSRRSPGRWTSTPSSPAAACPRRGSTSASPTARRSSGSTDMHQRAATERAGHRHADLLHQRRAAGGRRTGRRSSRGCAPRWGAEMKRARLPRRSGRRRAPGAARRRPRAARAPARRRGAGASATGPRPSSRTPEGGFRMGNPDAPVKVIEYLSLDLPALRRVPAESAGRLFQDLCPPRPGQHRISQLSCSTAPTSPPPSSPAAPPARYFAMTHELLGTQRAMDGPDRGADRRAAQPSSTACRRCRRCSASSPLLGLDGSPRATASPGRAARLPRRPGRPRPHRARCSRPPASIGVTGTPTFVDQRPADRRRPTLGGDRAAAARPVAARTGAGRTGAGKAAQTFRLQELRRAGRAARRGRPDRHRRPERLRQIERARGDPLGDGRKLSPSRCAAPAWTTSSSPAPRSRPARDFAEVTLLVERDSGDDRAATSRSRRWARSRSPGGSSAARARAYRVNGRDVRAEGRRLAVRRRRDRRPFARPWSARARSAR